MKNAPGGGSSKPPPGWRAATVARRGRFDLAPIIPHPPPRARACSWRLQVVLHRNSVLLRHNKRQSVSRGGSYNLGGRL